MLDEMLEDIDESWNELLKKNLKKKLEGIFRELSKKPPYQPKGKDIFNVFKMPIDKIKVVILGQDPYPTEGKATGYAFAVPPKFGMQGSLSVIREEIEKEFDLDKHSNSKEWKSLEHWIKSGVFLLNTALTVEIGKPRYHLKLKIWENFTKEVIKYISEKHPCIWLLWGRGAQSFEENISEPKKEVSDENIEKISIKNEVNYVLKAPHPSPSTYDGKYGNRLFCKIGHKNFSYANEILKKLGKEEIIW